MDRRNFLCLALAGGAAGMARPQHALAEAPSFDPLAAPAAGSLYYTKELPGRWREKVGIHLPRFSREGVVVQVTTPHEMNPYEHYIVKHQLFDENFKLIFEKLFDPLSDREAVSRHNISGHGKRIYALSLCNRHDAWLNVLEL